LNFNVLMKNLPRRIAAPLAPEICEDLKVGDRLLIGGVVYTARDAAHQRIAAALARGDAPPFDLDGAVIFYAGPSPAPPGRPIGAIGPTTSYRMDPFTPLLLERGLRGMIGKGRRSGDVVRAIARHRAVYFGAIGGIAALTAKCVQRAEVVAYEDLGPEAVRRLEIVDLPVVVVNDTRGGDLFSRLADG